jgi:hypothetical protein
MLMDSSAEGNLGSPHAVARRRTIADARREALIMRAMLDSEKNLGRNLHNFRVERRNC